MELDFKNRVVTRVYIDSSQVTSGSASNFELVLRSVINNCVAYQVESLTVPHSYLNMNPTSSTLSMPMSTSLDGAFTIGIPNLSYTDTTFISTVNAAVALLAPLSLPVFSFANGRLSITATAGTFSISAADIAASNMWSQYLGWPSAALLATNAKGTQYYNLGGPNTIYLHSRWLSAQFDRFVNGSELDVNNAIEGLPVNAVSGGNIYKLYPGAWQPVSNRILTKLDFSLRYNDGTLIDLQGLHWRATINLLGDSSNY